MLVRVAVSVPNPLGLTSLERRLLAELRSGQAPPPRPRRPVPPFRPDRDGRRGLKVAR